VEPSGDACDHWHRYESDLDLLRELGFGAYRFSLEWARIEPEEGEWSAAALDHYARVCDACRTRDLLPVLTLHHFTSPRWVAAEGGWGARRTAARFARFCERAARRLGDLIGIVCTINEPNVVASHGYELGEFAPGVRDPAARARAVGTFIAAHGMARDIVRAELPGVPVGLTLAMQDYHALPGGEGLLEEIRWREEDIFLEAARGDDFIGVQTYTRARVGPDGVEGPEGAAEKTLMGWEFWPEALGATVRRAARVTGAPVLVTENGIATADDDRRVEYVRRALTALARGMDDGVDVRGYFYWSLLDNFEWARGYAPTFGLVAVDRTTFARRPKPSASWLGTVARRHQRPTAALEETAL
jgi:beta-glucosidase